MSSITPERFHKRIKSFFSFYLPCSPSFLLIIVEFSFPWPSGAFYNNQRLHYVICNVFVHFISNPFIVTKHFLITIILVAGDPCRPNPCENGGTCNPGHGGKIFECMCREGFTGDKCQGKFTADVHYSAWHNIFSPKRTTLMTGTFNSPSVSLLWQLRHDTP